MPVDVQDAIQLSRAHDSDSPVTTARYMVEVVMNEEEPDGTEEEHKERLAGAIQDVLDEASSPLTDIRYDFFLFDVLSREVLDVAPPTTRED